MDTAVVCLLLTTLTHKEIALALDAAKQVVQRHSRAHRAAKPAVDEPGTRPTALSMPSAESSRRTGWADRLLLVDIPSTRSFTPARIQHPVNSACTQPV